MMTDDQEDHHSQDSQKSFQELMQYVLAGNNETASSTTAGTVPAAPFDVFGVNGTAWPPPEAESSAPQVGYECFSGVSVATTSTPRHLSFKTEDHIDGLSPDSGYHQPQSNESANINHEPPVTAHSNTSIPLLYEIQPQPIIPAPTTIPPRTNYPGQFGFAMSFERTEYAVKNANYTHSSDVKKLYAKMNVPCPIQFHCSNDPPPDACIRAMMVFMLDEQSHDPVTRCPCHMMVPDSRPELTQHIIQAVAQDKDCVYCDSYGRKSVIVPFTKPAVGEQNFTVLYKFMCLSSCVGGINRRPVGAVFTLEDCDGNVLGRCCIEVKICSSPGRDRKQDETRKRKISSVNNPAILPRKPKMIVQEPSPQEADDGEYFLIVRGKANFELLSKINIALNLASLATESQRQQCQRENDSNLKDMLDVYFRQLNG